MRLLLFLFVSLALTFSSCKKTKSESDEVDISYAPFTESWINKKQKGIDFFALGTEPFWNLEVGRNEVMKFYEMGSIDTIKIPSPVLYRDKKNSSWKYKGKSDSGILEVLIREGECSDNMSDNKYYYTVEVIANDKNEKEERRFIGCGSFLNDYRLNDIFALTEINGRIINPDDFISGVPYIEMNLPTGKIMGKAGCNSFHGTMKVGLNGKEITFGPFVSTRMSCPQLQQEDEFLKAISNTKVKYSFTSGGLIFTNEKNTLKFKKVD